MAADQQSVIDKSLRSVFGKCHVHLFEKKLTDK